MGMMFVGTKFCPHCGGAAAQVEVGKTLRKSCPRCQVPLQNIAIAKESLDQCPHCGGMWVAVQTFDRICGDAEAQTAATGLSLPPPVAPDPRVHYLKCPDCQSLMGRINYFRHSGVVLNVCRPHGLWLDRDQMRQVVEFIRAGGVERSKQIETEKMEDTRRSLEAQQRMSSGGQLDYFQD